MKKLIFALICLSVLLCSCRPAIVDSPDTTEPQSTDSTPPNEAVADTTNTETTAPVPSLPCLIGLYDDLENNGTYTRLSRWSVPWVSGKDIAVFDVIPSSANALTGTSYRRLWKEESDKISPDGLVSPYFILDYTLTDGTVKSVEIKCYADAEKITDEGYIEVYLYDDIHQEEGAWYYHLTESTTNADTVISSFKLTAGKEIESVKTITLSAYIEGSSAATVEIINGN